MFGLIFIIIIYLFYFMLLDVTRKFDKNQKWIYFGTNHRKTLLYLTAFSRLQWKNAVSEFYHNSKVLVIFLIFNFNYLLKTYFNILLISHLEITSASVKILSKCVSVIFVIFYDYFYTLIFIILTLCFLCIHIIKKNLFVKNLTIFK